MELERHAIIAALRNSNGNIEKAARELGASRRTLQNRMREYGLPRGRAGRRKKKLPYRRSRSLVVGLGALAVGTIGVLTLRRRFRQQIEPQQES